jgi:hypothetical protein
VTHLWWVPGALARRCDVREKYASLRAPPCSWTFLSSLTESEFFSILLEWKGGCR